MKALAAASGKTCAMLSFPRYGETGFGKLAGQYLDGRFGGIDEVSVEFAALLYAGDRYESRSLLLELRQQHDLVILDRYVASNIAYGAAKLPADQRGRLIEWLREVEIRHLRLAETGSGLFGRHRCGVGPRSGRA